MGESGTLIAQLRRLIPLLTIALLAAVAYDGWVFYGRWSDARQAERSREEKEARDARKTLDALGGGGLKVLGFYATRGEIRRGDHASLCYAVTGAQRVRMEPSLEALHPALSYCVQVSPEKDTEYKLTAEDSAGRIATATATIRVVR